jgi:two-component system chemotaxis sensor kinase CheA
MPPPGAVPAPELNDVATLAGRLAAGDASVLVDLRPALHRVVVTPSFSGAVKTLAVQALLLLDDPRVVEGGAGTPLLLKVRKLVESALAAHASGAGTPTPIHGVLTITPDALLSAETDRALVAEFVVEAREQLEIAEAALLGLDGDPDDVQALDTLFRALHTIKGTSAFIGVEHATELAHHTESLLARVRTGAATCTGELSNLIFRAIDMLDAMVVAIESAADGDPVMLPDGFRPLLDSLRDGLTGSDANRHAAPHRISGQLARLRQFESTVRVRVEELDRLSGAVRELVLTQAMVARDPALRLASSHDLARKIAHAAELAVEIEGIVNELHAVPFGATLRKLARAARDAAQRTGKRVELVADGHDVLIERAAAEALADPLLHMVRNAVDHGIEDAAERAALGKPAAGQLTVRAERAGATLIIEVSDDGRGIDPARLAGAARERGLIAAGVELSEADALALVFRPGFSTSDLVTDLSGRGVGMDVVQTNVAALGGTIDIASRVGGGTTFTIRLPFRSRSARSAPTGWTDPARSIGLIA